MSCLRCDRDFVQRNRFIRICPRCKKINNKAALGMLPTYRVPGIRSLSAIAVYFNMRAN